VLAGADKGSELPPAFLLIAICLVSFRVRRRRYRAQRVKNRRASWIAWVVAHAHLVPLHRVRHWRGPRGCAAVPSGVKRPASSNPFRWCSRLHHAPFWSFGLNRRAIHPLLDRVPTSGWYYGLACPNAPSRKGDLVSRGIPNCPRFLVRERV